MSYIIAGYHTIFESWQGNVKKETLHKYIYISDDWDAIIKFYNQGLGLCASYFYYYVVKLDTIFNLKTPTHKFNVKNANQMPKSLATHHFDELIDNLIKPKELNQILTSVQALQAPQARLYYYHNNNTHEAILSQSLPEIVLKNYENNKNTCFKKTCADFSQVINKMDNYRDFYMVENLVRKHLQLIEKNDFKHFIFECNKSICLNTIIGFDNF